MPLEQAQLMYDALRARGVPTALLVFDGESHDLRRADTLRRGLEAELSFLGQVFGLPIDEEIEPLEVVPAPPAN